MAPSSLAIRPRRAAAKKARNTPWLDPWVTWRADGFRDLTCPACRRRSVMNKLLDASPPFEPRKRYALYTCEACGTMHYPDAPAFEYESRRDADIARKFYVEVGAGLDAMIAPLAWAEPERTASYLEVGGGYGFSVDFAARALGWRAANIDPSFIARIGARDLGHTLKSEYLSADRPQPDGPFDRVLSSEVIEHVADPDPFLAAIAAATAEAGAAIITTPDAAAVRKDAPDATLRPIIVAGHHLVLYSAAGLELALRRAGFDHVSVRTGDMTLYAVASRRPLQVDFTARPDRSAYRAYLRERRDALAADPALHAGFAVRYLKECVHTGAYDEADAALTVLTARWRRDFGLDLDLPDGVKPQFRLPEKNRRRAIRRFAANHPFNLAIALFYAGRVQEESGEHARAEASYRACVRAARATQRVFKAMFAACRETEDAERRAGLHAAMLAVRRSPETAVRALLTLAPDESALPADLWRDARLKVFADAVLSGRGESAEPLFPHVRTLLDRAHDAGRALSPAEGYAAAAVAMRALQTGRRSEAPGWFALARDAMTDPKERAVFEAERLRCTPALTGSEAQAAGAALIAAVNSGDAEAAAQHAEPFLQGRATPDELTAPVAFAIGLRALNMQAEPSDAATWFKRAAALEQDPYIRAEAWYHEVLALDQAGHAEAARCAAASLCDPGHPDAAALSAALGSRFAALRRYNSAA